MIRLWYVEVNGAAYYYPSVKLQTAVFSLAKSYAPKKPPFKVTIALREATPEEYASWERIKAKKEVEKNADVHRNAQS
ncbi:MAG: hypothetical protein WC759_00035 [Candidatus Micrarchaeia archaeon]|jgi:hypothetical protein